MKISVLITVYNRPDMVRACLDALAMQSRLPDEVVVADDGSSLQNSEAIRGLLDQSRLVTHYARQEDEGFRLAAARNLAIRASCGDYLVSIDSDILLLPETLAVHEQRAAPGVFLAGNRALLDRETSERILRDGCRRDGMEGLWATADKRHLVRAVFEFHRHALQRRLGLSKRHKPRLLGCHVSFFRSDIEKVNGFDENYAGWGFEDDDLATRFYMIGVRSRAVVRQARALHLWHRPASTSAGGPMQSPNSPYFHRSHVEAVCERGLAQKRPSPSAAS